MEYAIGIDLGGTSIKYALVDKAGNSFFEGKITLFCFCLSCKSDGTTDKGCHLAER